MLRRRHKLEKDDAVHRDIAASRSANHSPECAKRNKVSGASNRASKYASDEDGSVESWLASNKIGANTPKASPDYQANVVCNGAVTEAGDIGELVGDGRADSRYSLGPEVVNNPAKACYNEQRPLKSAILISILDRAE